MIDILNQIFGFYDQIIANIPVGYQAAISLILVILLLWNIFLIIKSGHWIFITVLIVFLPGTWPAAKKIAELFYLLIKGLIIRAGLA